MECHASLLWGFSAELVLVKILGSVFWVYFLEGPMLGALCELRWLVLTLCNTSGTVVTINLNIKNLSKITQIISGMSGPLPQVIAVLGCFIITCCCPTA